MDWQVNASRLKSSASEKPFAPGDTMVSYLTRAEQGEIVRIDLREEERGELGNFGPVVGWWSSIVPTPEETQAETNKQQLRTTEGIFLSLYPEPEDEDEDAETDESAEDDQAEQEIIDDPELAADRDTLKYLLSLMLERKRILKPVGRAKPGDPTIYRHPKLDREFEVPSIDITGEAVLRIQEQLQAIIG